MYIVVAHRPQRGRLNIYSEDHTLSIYDRGDAELDEGERGRNINSHNSSTMALTSKSYILRHSHY